MLTRKVTLKTLDYRFFDATSLTNILGMYDMFKRGHRVFIDTDIENSFLVTNKKTAKITKFPCDKRGLYV